MATSQRDRFDEQADALTERIVSAIAPIGSTSQGRRETVREQVSRECGAIAAALRAERAEAIEEAARLFDDTATTHRGYVAESEGNRPRADEPTDYEQHHIDEALRASADARRLRALLTPDAIGKASKGPPFRDPLGVATALLARVVVYARAPQCEPPGGDLTLLDEIEAFVTRDGGKEPGR
jgi:hypothetical protein